MKNIHLIFKLLLEIYFCIGLGLTSADEESTTITTNSNLIDQLLEGKTDESLLPEATTEIFPLFIDDVTENLIDLQPILRKTVLTRTFTRMHEEQEKQEIQDAVDEHFISDDIFQRYLPKDYNKLEIPKGDEEGPVEVSIYLSIRSISEIDEVNEKISLEMDVIISWLDRIVFDSFKKNVLENLDYTSDLNAVFKEKTLDPIFLTKIWKPDIYIDSLVDVNKPALIVKPARLKINNGGLITYTARLTTKLDCDLDFAYYPGDTQKCNIILRSYSYNSSDLKLMWDKPEGVFLLKLYDDNFDLAIGDVRRYSLSTKVHGSNEINKIENETYEVLQFTLFARRRLSYQLLQTYIPSMLYIAITWLCFMIPSRMIEARVAIAMTTLLTLTAMFASVRESTPVVSYIKAIDYWMVAGICFVFLTLLEFAILLWTESAKHEEEEKRKQEEELGTKRNRHEAPPSLGQKIRKKVLLSCTIIITFVENYSFVLILLIFMSFNVLYWSWFFINSGYFLWKVDPMHNAVVEDHVNEEKIVEELDLFG